MKEIFIVFACDRYYPSGGMSDAHGIFRTEKEALNHANQFRNSHDYVWITRINLETLTEETV
jgi:hypothetical protein